MQFLTKYTSDHVEYGGYEEEQIPHPYTHLETFECDCPGIVAVMSFDNCLKLLYPSPRPVNKDPLFQPAESVDESGRFTFRFYIKDSSFKHDYGYCIDAPNEFPAGACAFFSTEDDAYGAYQLTIERQGKYDDQEDYTQVS